MTTPPEPNAEGVKPKERPARLRPREGLLGRLQRRVRRLQRQAPPAQKPT